MSSSIQSHTPDAQHELLPRSFILKEATTEDDDFFNGDDGHSVLSLNSQTSSIRSISSLASVMEDETLSMHLEILCDYIRDHKSLSNATIVSSSTYKQRTFMAVQHRFLVLHLRRSGKRDVWLRLDRLRSRELDLVQFV